MNGTGNTVEMDCDLNAFSRTCTLGHDSSSGVEAANGFLCNRSQHGGGFGRLRGPLKMGASIIMWEEGRQKYFYDAHLNGDTQILSKQDALVLDKRLAAYEKDKAVV